MPFRDTLHARWSILDVKRIWTRNLHKDYTGLQWPSVYAHSGKWLPTVGLLIETTVNGTTIGPPKPVVFPLLYGSSLTSHYTLDYISFEISPRQMGPRIAGGGYGPAPDTVEYAPFETLIQREYQELLGEWNKRDVVSHKVLSGFVFLKRAKERTSKTVASSANLAKLIADKAFGSLIAAGTFSNPTTATLGFASSSFTKALVDAFLDEADDDEDLLYELGTTPSQIPVLNNLPSLPSKEPNAAGTMLQLKDMRELIAIDSWDWIWHRPSPGPGNLVGATPDIKINMKAEARTRLFVYRS